MGTAANVLVGSGKIYGAPVGTALPTTETASLNVAFVDLGYISDAGVQQSISKSTTTIKAWGGDVVRKLTTEHDLTYKFEMLETNPDSLEAYYGDQTAPATAVQIKQQAGLRQPWVVHIIDGTNLVRIVIPDGEVIELADVNYSTDSAIAYGVTISAYADGSGVKAYKYVHDTGAS